MTYAERVARHRRLIVLRALAGENGGRLNERDIQGELDVWGHRLGRDDVRALLRWLSDAAAIVLTHPGEVLMVAEITQRGDDHVARRGEPIEGIDLPSRI